MFVQYIKFLINGGALGLVGLVLQASLFQLLGGKTGMAYAMASMLTYLPLIGVNFLIQRRMIFAATGVFWRFILANLLIMGFVSSIAAICRDVMTGLFGEVAGNNSGFIAAALIGATPSFLLARYWVFETAIKRKVVA